jgi:hypothetical protein
MLALRALGTASHIVLAAWASQALALPPLGSGTALWRCSFRTSAGRHCWSFCYMSTFLALVGTRRQLVSLPVTRAAPVPTWTGGGVRVRVRVRAETEPSHCIKLDLLANGLGF